MDTPISSRRRRCPKWLMETRRLDVSTGSDSSTSTPSHMRHTDAMFSPMTPSAELMRGASDYDEDDMLMPCTQMFNQKREVFWNYEASPRTRARLQRQIEANDEDEDAVEVRPLPKPKTPVMKIQAVKSRMPSLIDLQNDQDFQFLNQIVLNTKNKSSNEEKASANKESSPPDNADPFDQDDSFLVACSQAIEEKAFNEPTNIDSNFNHKFKLPPQVASTKPDKKLSECNEMSVFDDEDADEFEMLLSQIEIPIVTKVNPPPKAAPAALLRPPPARPFAPHVPAAKSGSGSFNQKIQPQNPISNLDNSKNSPNFFKRFKSADDAAKETSLTVITSRPASVPSTARTVTSSFRRNNSEPQTPAGPLPGGRQIFQTMASKCSKEEIERKRQEALRRRQLSSQKLN